MMIDDLTEEEGTVYLAALGGVTAPVERSPIVIENDVYGVGLRGRRMGYVCLGGGVPSYADSIGGAR